MPRKPRVSIVGVPEYVIQRGHNRQVVFSAIKKQLSIFSRGLVREDIARQVLLELASIGREMGEANTDKTSEHDNEIKPYMDKFLKARM
jgi:hypothetical protein